MTNYSKLFEKAKAEGITALEIAVEKNSNFSFGLFRNEIDSYKVSDSYSLQARGIYDGKFGYASAERFDRETIDYLISHIKENAGLSTAKEEPIIFKGSEKYHKKSIFSRKLAAATAEEKIALVRKLDRQLRDTSELLKETQIRYSDSTEEITLMNSYGLKLNAKNNYGYIYCSAIAIDEKGETKNGGEIKIFNDLADVDTQKLAEKVSRDTLVQFGSGPCKSGRYKAVFSPEAVSSLLPFFLNNLSSEQVQKKSSLLAGKLGE
ncbi:MAG: hypothetical protein II712_00535, partial [Erysipelotrichaceae bacterium]|nr:hypothetical protein [Erysipelotrichaceae bacterium]